MNTRFRYLFWSALLALLMIALAVVPALAEQPAIDITDATLRARKYNDLNMNGERDTDEPYLEGWTIHVYDDQDVLFGSETTDVDGWAVWQVPPGDYTVCEVVEQHWVNTQAGVLKPGAAVNGEACSQLQTLGPGADWTFLFGNYELPRLRVFKYNDLNMDGQRQNFGDNPEVGLEGWTFNIYDGEGLPVDSQMTGPNGYYTWRVPPGAYTVCEELQPGWANTQAGDLKPGIPQDTIEVCSHEQTLMPGELYMFSFGNYELPATGTIVIVKEAEPADGTLFDFEVLLDTTFVYSVTLSVEPPNTSDSSTIDGLAVPATYTIKEATVEGWNPVSLVCDDDNGAVIDVTTAEVNLEPEEVVTCAFRNEELATLRVRKYHDEDMSGKHESGEAWLQDWTMNVYDAQDALLDSQKTDENGWYVWQVPAGDYTVCEELKSGWVNTQAGNLKPGTAVNGEVCSQLQTLEPGSDWSFLFGNYELPTLRARKYYDVDRNGERNDGEPYLEGWTINVYNDQDALVDSKATDADGWAVWQVPVGDYTVCEELQDGWANTQAGVLTPGAAVNGEACSQLQALGPSADWTFLFGNYEKDATLRARKYNDLNMNGEHDTDEPYLAGWTINVYDDQDALVDSQVTDENGWYVWTVSPGDYTVCEELQDHWVNTQAGVLKPGAAVNGEACSQLQTLGPGADWTFLFGNYELPRLRVLKYNDLNMDGQRQNFGDNPEVGLEGWTFNVYDGEGLPVDSQTTGPNGYYTWRVPPGAYTVCEELQSGWANTQAGDLKPGIPQDTIEVCSHEQTLMPGELYMFSFGNYELPPPANYCPAEDPNVGYELTEVLGVGMGSMRKAVRTRRLNIPDWQNVNELYGQLAAMEIGRIRFVRFRYPDKTYVQIKQPTSPAYQPYAIKWWGADLDPARFIKGQFRWIRDGRRAPRAFVLWPTYETFEQYANVFTVFDDSETNHVYWDDRPDAVYVWYPEQTHVLTLPATQAPGADIVVKMALVDNNDDNRPVIVTVSANGVSEQRVIYGPNMKDTLNLETFLLENVPAGTNEVVIHLLSPDPSVDYPAGGDSAAIIGAVAGYACVEDNIVEPEPTVTGHRR